MANEIMIPEAGALSAELFNSDLVALVNDAASTGMSSRVPRITTNGKQFVLVDSAGVETPLRAGDLTMGPDGNTYLPALALRAKADKPLPRAWYLKPYVQGETSAPDCFSNGGGKPDPSIPTPQCEVCANCQHNAWGSGKDSKGNATKGKACGEFKILAVYAKGGIYELKIMPTALGNWDRLINQVKMIRSADGAQVPLPFIRILIGFDEDAKHQLYTFQYGGIIDTKIIPKITQLVRSPEAEEIVTRQMTYVADEPSAPAAAGNVASMEAEKKKKADAAKKAQDEKVKKEAAAAAQSDDLGLGLEDEKPEPAQAQSAGAELTDDEIAAELGL